MKRFLIGLLAGLFLGWITVPFVKAAYDVATSDRTATVHVLNNTDVNETHAYKWYLMQMLLDLREANQHLQNIEDNTLAVKKKVGA